mmetsp:Transcript_80938/g.229152  ORF Transcript_80938/g.229152 Transcript_80938/m.229152 type:complete len:157 (+) Transcript_80938:92-562(+)
MGRSTLATARCARGAMGRRSGRAQGRLAALLVFAAACATTRFHVFVAQGPTARGGARCKWNGGRECLCDNGASPCKYDSRAEASKAGTTVPRGAGAALSLDDLEPPELFDLEPAPVRVAEDSTSASRACQCGNGARPCQCPKTEADVPGGTGSMAE